MEQDHRLRRDTPSAAAPAAPAARDVAVLLAAHGERRPGAGNENVRRIEHALARKPFAAEVKAGFISGQPTVSEVLDLIAAPNVFVYPLFAANGYFTRDRLAQLVEQADRPHRAVKILPPLGLDPGLPALLFARAVGQARSYGFGRAAALLLLGHGSRRFPQSSEAASDLASAVRSHGWFSAVEFALLEQRPFLSETMARLRQPVIVVGLFSGDGLHGAIDAPRVVAELGRDDVAYIGAMGAFPGIEDLVEAAVARALRPLAV